MAQVNTKELDIESWGSPVQSIYDTPAGPIVDTRTLDFESWGMPVQYLFFYEASATVNEIRRSYIFGFPS